MIFLTTTAIEMDEELLNRCIVLTVDEGREQTRAIHALQRTAQTLEGLLARHERERILKRAPQRAAAAAAAARGEPLRPRADVPRHATRTRRDHMKYLTLIRADRAACTSTSGRVKTDGASRARGVEYIEVTKDDIALANRLAMRCWGAAWTSCRRRRGGCSGSSTTW